MVDQILEEKAREERIIDSAVAEGGAYEVIRKRLVEQGKRLQNAVGSLNSARLEEFGSSDMSVIARVRVRTENNCIARDIVQVGDLLLFGYNVFIGLKKETRVEDVFALFRYKDGSEGLELEPVELKGSFLEQTGFVNDFDELYRYYKHTRLMQLRVKDGKLLAGFQIGERIEDVRVFRWAVSADGKTVSYIDNRGERDIQLPAPFDFEWITTTRDDTVHGRHPHVNILDTVFVETVGGDLTIKIENNTEDGLGIYREPVEDKTQSLDDGQFCYARVGSLILMKIRPYKEEKWRFFIFNTLNQQALRVDAIGDSCVQLPEDHGVIFPGGYYLQTGEFKSFDEQVEGLRFKRMIRSPNGEDVLYLFYHHVKGLLGLFAYNLIEKKLHIPLFANGYALSEDGRLVIFNEQAEPVRVHPMQIWQTPYQSAEYASKAAPSQTFYGRIGNAELVRGISNLYSVCRLIDNQSVSASLYEELSKAAARLFDSHYWLNESEMAELATTVRDITQTSELVIDEFEKVQSIQKQSAQTMRDTEASQEALRLSVRPDNWESAEQYVDALARLRKQRGHLVTIRDYRYIDVKRIGELDQELQTLEVTLSEQTLKFLSDEKSLEPYYGKLAQMEKAFEAASSIAELTPVVEQIESTASGLDLLSELMGSLKVDDATLRTRIIEAISQVYSKLNQSKAKANLKRKNLGSSEAVAQFGAQFKLFAQSITNALGMATTPEKCDEQLSRLLVQLEELESQFSDHEQFLADIMEKREEVYESFESHKQQLLDERQRKAQTIADAAGRILTSIEKRSLKFTQADELNTWFASDPLVAKVRELVVNLRELDNAVKAEDIEARFKGLKDQSQRALRDKTDIFEDGGNVIKLGPRHRFSVNTQELDLTILPRGSDSNEQGLVLHLTGTNFFEPIVNEELYALRQYWNLSLISETSDVYRAEYLAWSILQAALKGEEGLSMDTLHNAWQDEAQKSEQGGELTKLVRDYANPRYREGYEKGVHDHDAVKIMKTVLPVYPLADLLVYAPRARALAQLFWHRLNQKDSTFTTDVLSHSLFLTWPERAQSAAILQNVFSTGHAFTLLAEEIAEALGRFVVAEKLPFDEAEQASAAQYLALELGREQIEFIRSQYAVSLVDELKRSVDAARWNQLRQSLDKLHAWPREAWKLCHAWLQALIEQKDLQKLARYIDEAVAHIVIADRVPVRSSNVDMEIKVVGLLGSHPLIENQSLHFALDAFLQRLLDHHTRVIPAYQHYLALRQRIINEQKDALRLDSFKARPLTSFVRNRLINESYLPLIGDNLAKQMGTVGENKRSDLMGLLMMISPPGYGKTTLMEYVANRLGLIFMRINGPALGHEVLSLDPQQAPNATARQELEKLNLALEMGNNVMLYIDDIQHTHAEFLQKFISLCDGTRRIEGVWKGKTKTYDMRGKKFCVVMSGNPYTESGEAFKVPDMLANRADIYNLGDILGGMEEQFALSYIENAMTSNPVLTPLATRDQGDIYRLIDLAKGKNVATTDLRHSYSGAEINEITSILQKMFVIQEVLLKINQQYIASAAQNDKYRVEPPFKLQGSYRNMGKMTEKLSAVMNQQELMQMIQDHYLGEAQLLTTGTEDNLLKLAELRGNMTPEQKARWDQIKQDFLKNKAMGGDDADTGAKLVGQMVDLVRGVEGIKHAAERAKAQPVAEVQKQPDTSELIEKIDARVLDVIKALSSIRPQVEVINQPVPGIDKILSTLADTIEHSLMPVVKSMDKKLDIDLRTHHKLEEIFEQLRGLGKDVEGLYGK